MRLRAKLLLTLSLMVAVVGVCVSFIFYLTARAKLQREAEEYLVRSADMLVAVCQRRIDRELRRVECWAVMPMVVQTAVNYRDRALCDAFEAYFSNVLAGESFSSVFIVNPAGDCVASSDSRRLYHPYCRDVVSRKPTVQAAFEGISMVGPGELSLATGRPGVTLTAPVWHDGEVVGVLRTGLDMGLLAADMLEPLQIGERGKAYVFDPELDMSLPDGHSLHAPVAIGPYVPPPEPLRRAFTQTSRRAFRYSDDTGSYLCAAFQMSRPPWVFAVALPVGEVLAPLYALRRATLVVVVLTILLLLGVVRMITAPVVNGIEACRALAEDISSGRLDRRLKVTSGDEVGQLAHSLNAMADQLDRNRRQVAAAEQKYRAIFENAVEGIFQTSVDGTVVAVNPALAALVGAESPDDLIGINVLSYYSDPALREIFLAQLRVHGAVHGFEGDIHRLDGTPRHVLLNARAEYNADGEIQTIRGFMEDVTERRAAEARAQNARETEDLLLRTELEMLRYQIDPHFLFNALTSLRELVLRDQQAGARMIESLAAFCRSGLLHRSDSVSTVGEEIAHAQSYLEVQAVRFGDRLRFRVDVEDAVREAPMPAFIVQPLAENGVKYGRKSGGNPLEVVLKAVADEPGCVLTVSNTGRWFAPEETQKSPGTQLGLDNVRKRLARCFGQRAQLSVLEADGWVTVSVSFPCDYARRSSGAAGDAAFR